MSGTQDGNFCRRVAQRFRVRWRQINTSEVKRLDEESETESPTLCEASPRLQVTDGQPVLCPGCWKEGRAGGRGVFSQQAEGVCVAPILSPVCLQQHTHTHSHTHTLALSLLLICVGVHVSFLLRRTIGKLRSARSTLFSYVCAAASFFCLNKNRPNRLWVREPACR